MAEEEPLHEWAARRDGAGRRNGRLPAHAAPFPLADGARASHVAPDAPRALLGWERMDDRRRRA
jgi:hypothetical protein